MTRGLVRWQREDDLHFVTFSCYQRRPLLGTATSRDCFVTALEKFRARDEFDVVGYVVMPEHVHLLMGEPSRCLLSESLHALKLSVAKTLRAVPSASGHRAFWTSRYYDSNLCTHDAMVECLRYIHRNPVKRGLVQEPEDWRWSSYRHYYLQEESTVALDSAWSRRQPKWSPTAVIPEEEDREVEM